MAEKEKINMGIALRAALFGGSILTFIFISRYIKKSRVRIEDTLFWIVFSAILVVIGIFPQIPIILSRLLKIESPANFVFLAIIFILLIHQFFLTMKLSQTEIKLRELVQTVAIENKKESVSNIQFRRNSEK